MRSETLFLAGVPVGVAIAAQGTHMRMNGGDKLTTGQDLKAGGGRAVMQGDGNFVVYNPNGVAVWSTRTAGKPVAFALMQTDGNFVLYDKNMHPYWSTGTQGHPGAYFLFQSDGNIVVYTSNGAVLWTAGIQGWQKHESSSNVFESAASAVSSVASGAVKVAGDVAHIVGEAAVAPLDIAKNIAAGERLDHVFIDAAKAQLKVIKDAAPYATAVISFVPGIGTTAAAAIAGGIALAEGKSIDEVAKAAIRGAIPGGSVAQAAFDTAMKVASGERLDKAVLEAARNAIPEGPARQAFDIGTAVATGEKIQNAIAKGLTNMAGDQIQKVLADGAKAVTDNPTLKNALAALPSNPTIEQGFKIASGLIAQANMNEKALAAVRAGLPPDSQQGFDAAVKTQAPHKPWLANVVGGPARIQAVTPRAPAKPAPALSPSPIKAVTPKAAPAAAQAAAKAPPGQDRRYGPYPQHTAGVGASGGGAWRWFRVYANGKPIANRGWLWMSDDAANAERAGFIEATQGRGYIGTVTQWDWDPVTRQAKVAA